MREQERFRPKIYEDEAIVLDVVPPRWSHRPGHHGQFNRAYLLGTEHFTLLEAAVSPEINLVPGNVLYIGKDVPRDIVRIVRRISYQELPETAKMELERAVERIVKEKERKFVEFFNTCGPLTPRLHALEVIPGIGKKTMLKVLEEREKKPFESFEDIDKRTGIQDSRASVIKRILQELSDPTNRYFLFVRGPSQ
jgi:putative nucleotide binding protein